MDGPVVNYVISPFERNINYGDSQGLKFYLQSTKEIDQEENRLDISVSNCKDIIDHFISLANKYGWGRLLFMGGTGVGANNIFRQVYQIQISDIHHQAHGYFGQLGMVNLGNSYLPNPLVVSTLQKLAGSVQELQIPMIGCAQI